MQERGVDDPLRWRVLAMGVLSVYVDKEKAKTVIRIEFYALATL